MHDSILPVSCKYGSDAIVNILVKIIVSKLKKTVSIWTHCAQMESHCVQVNIYTVLRLLNLNRNQSKAVDECM